jgi:pimeloyl-[acyl-carrier protein] methyl ester esterase
LFWQYASFCMKEILSINRTGRGKPIVLLHGWGMNASVFGPLCDLLAGYREVITVDLPGYGKSQWHPSLSFEDQAALISAKIPAGTLIGWSMGGLYATEMVRQNPDRFDRLILMCSNPCFVRRGDWGSAVNEEVFDAFARSLEQGWSSTIKHFLSLQMLGNSDARHLVRELIVKLELAGEPDPAALDFGLNLLKTTDTRSVLSKVKLPVDMIFGERDALVPISVAKEISDVNSRIRVESLADAAHAPFLSHTAQIAAMI